MKCILMNKNTKVMTLEYFSLANFFTKIYEVNNIDYAPLIVYNGKDGSEDDLKVLLSDWFNDRCVPKRRENLDMLLARLNLSSRSEFLNKAYGLSLTDQYWLKPFDSKVEWKNINFFQNNFNDIEFTEATFVTNSCKLSVDVTFNTPNNTTDGVLRKSWIIDNNIRYLVKASSKRSVLEPYNEWLASMICKRLGFDSITYDIDIVKNTIVSKCPCFIDDNTELIKAYQILHKNCDKTNAYYDYIKILTDHNIKNAQEKIDNMFILDYIMLNTDRHLNNFGIIRNVDTLEWVDVAPIFDTGNSLVLYGYNDGDEVIIEENGRFFYDIDNFDNIIKRIGNLKRIDISKLNGIVEEYDDLLHKYQEYNHLSDNYIHTLCVVLNRQIGKLKKIIEEGN